MEKERSSIAKTAGILLTAYTLIYIIEYWTFDQGLLYIIGLVSYLMILAAGVTLVINNIKLSRAFMLSGTILNLVTLYTEGTREIYTRYDYSIPDIYTLIPVLIWLSILFYAIVLISNGHTSWIPAVFSACTQIAAMILQFKLFKYITGHPSPLNVIIPLEFIISVLLAAKYVSTLERHTILQRLLEILTVRKGLIIGNTLSQITIDTICRTPVETIVFMYYPDIQSNGRQIELKYTHKGTAGGRNSFASDVKMIINNLENNTLFELIMTPKRLVSYFLAAWITIALIMQLILLYMLISSRDYIHIVHFSPILMGVAGIVLSIVLYYGSVCYYRKQFRAAILKTLNSLD